MGSFLKLKDTIVSNEKFLLIGHEQPDGDSIGSILALGEGLRQLGKKVSMVCKDELPPVFRFLFGAENIKRDFLGGDFEAVILIDNGDLKRTGFSERLLGLKKRRIKIVNIDHHPKNDLWRFSDVNHACVTASSVAEIIYRILLDLKVKLTPSMATNLLCGIFNDTGGFRHSNTSEEVLNVVSQLLSLGAKLKLVSRSLSNSKTIPSLKLWGIALDRLKFNKELGIAFSIILQDDIKLAEASEDDVSGLVNLLNSASESEVALLLYEGSDGKIKGSIRTESDKIDVSSLASVLCGGGHRKASGFSLSGRLKLENGRWDIR